MELYTPGADAAPLTPASSYGNIGSTTERSHRSAFVTRVWRTAGPLCALVVSRTNASPPNR